MHTVIVVLIGIVLAAALYVATRLRVASFAALRPWFTGFWALGTAVDFYVGVAFLGRSSSGGLPLFLVAAIVPIAFAFVLPWFVERLRGRS